MFIVTMVSESQYINFPPGGKTQIKMSWADGMIGACPVFDTLEAAEAYNQGRADIRELEELDNE